MIKYVSHNVTEDGNFPSQSNFDLISYWKLPTNRKGLLSYIGLVNLYHRYAPYFKIYMNPLHKIPKQFYMKPIVVVKLAKARAVWQSMTQILIREGAALRVSEFFFKAVVQLVLIFDA